MSFAGPGCDLISPLSTVCPDPTLLPLCCSYTSQPHFETQRHGSGHLPGAHAEVCLSALTGSHYRVSRSQARGKGYRGDEEGIEPIYQLEAGSSVASWVTQPHNYARMQVIILMRRLACCTSAAPGPSCLGYVRVLITVATSSSVKHPQHVH